MGGQAGGFSQRSDSADKGLPPHSAYLNHPAIDLHLRSPSASDLSPAKALTELALQHSGVTMRELLSIWEIWLCLLSGCVALCGIGYIEPLLQPFLLQVSLSAWPSLHWHP